MQKSIIESGLCCAAVVMQREDPVPQAPANLSIHEKLLFDRHFQERYELENQAFGNLTPKQVFGDVPTRYCTSAGLNSRETVNFVNEFKPDLAFIFGTDIIKGELLDILPEDKINLHLGLSPWYRGSATLFWPFYFLQPQYAGVTFHRITQKTDAGDMIHQCVPDLIAGDGIHDVGVRSIKVAHRDLSKLMKLYATKGAFSYFKQTSTGKLFLTTDFHASHLRVIYDLYQNKIVDEFLVGNLRCKYPEIISAI